MYFDPEIRTPDFRGQSTPLCAWGHFILSKGVWISDFMPQYVHVCFTRITAHWVTGLDVGLIASYICTCIRTVYIVDMCCVSQSMWLSVKPKG